MEPSTDPVAGPSEQPRWEDDRPHEPSDGDLSRPGVDPLPELPADLDPLPELPADLDPLPELPSDLDPLPNGPSDLDPLPASSSDVTPLPAPPSDFDQLPGPSSEVTPPPGPPSNLDPWADPQPHEVDPLAEVLPEPLPSEVAPPLGPAAPSRDVAARPQDPLLGDSAESIEEPAELESPEPELAHPELPPERDPTTATGGPASPPTPPALERTASTPQGRAIGAPALPSARAAVPPGPGRPRSGEGRIARGERRTRSPLARILAVVALAAVVVAVVLLVRTLRDSGHVKAVARPTVVKILIPEGKTRVQIAQIAAAEGLRGSYRDASRRSRLLDPVRYGAPHGTPDLEGFLFPATYDASPGESVSRLLGDQLLAFRENFGAGEIARARALHVTPYQLLTVASMVEREAQVPADRPKIAAVIYNRLRRGMPLGIDATIYYAVELRDGIATYTHELSKAQLQINSPYNTRTHAGLPPTPISNPGLASIHAAANPAHDSYIYYVAAADGCGEQVFSTTLAAFEANAAAYHAAVAKNGGHPPACKKK
jgi:peptidoglycan lytic transglycosylase G